MRKTLTPIDIDELTKDDWRELGFFYDYDKSDACWRLVGSRQGLLNFCSILNEYAADVRKTPLSEHEHYGPYWYLKLVTWNEAVITARDIRGTQDDFRRLSEIIQEKLNGALLGDHFIVDKEYSRENEAKMSFDVKEDSFDAAKADPLL